MLIVPPASAWLYSTWMTVFSGTLVALTNGLTACAVAAVLAGAPAVVYRVPAGGGKAEVLFKTADQHIRCLLLAADGTLWAGSDG